MIQKPIATWNGPATFHVLKKIESHPPFSMFTLTFDSYADEATYLAGGNLMYRYTIPMPATGSISNPGDAAEAWLLTDATSPLQGGQIAADRSDSLDAKRARKAVEMSQSCADAILAGFDSSALGELYAYPAKPNDQTNLTASVLASLLPASGPDWVTPFWCADATGAWAFRAHTAAQIQQVGVDAKAAILNCMTINEQLRAQILVADAAQLATIGWPA
jgi:hypothetical protein